MSRMENSVKDTLHCEEQLRTTLYCDDKEKLRKKLVLLQREYLRTAERLQRAERTEAVRRHVRSRITQQNHQDQRDREVTPEPCQIPPPLKLDTQNKITSDVPQHQGPTGADYEMSRTSPVIRFLLPSDAACPQTPDPCHDEAKSHRPSPALRLRSRRSRLRWEKRAAEGSRSTDNSEEGLEQSERTETSRAEGSEEKVNTEGREVVNESEELFSGADSESPSLLLTHWNTCGPTETGNMEGKERQGGQEEKTESRAEGKKESERSNLLPTCGSPAIHTEGRDGSQNKRKETEGGDKGETRRGDRIGQFCEDSSNQDTVQNAAEGIESEKSHDKSVEIKEEKREVVGGEHDVKGVGLLDSCTLVEGLLFPAEYYVRTTRRMTSSQSQPDMQAVILSQLSSGRPRRRSRGRGRGLNRHTHNYELSDERSEADFSLLTAASPSVGRRIESQVADTPAELNSPSSSEISDQISACQIDMDTSFSPTVTTARPGRGRKRRGRGRGRPQTPRCAPQPDFGQTSDDPLPTSSPVSSFPSLEGADGPKTCITPQEAVPVPDDSQPASIHSTATQPSSGGNRAQCSSASGHQVYPIFLKSSGRTNRSSHMSRCTESWRSLLLPSSPPAQTSLLPLPSLSSSLMINNLMNFDIPQDFHLPDDQFASLKLHKLRQVAVESGVEHFTSPSFNTRRSIRRSEICHSSGDPVMPLPLQLSLTPTIPHSNNPSEAKHTSTQSIDLQNLSREHKLTGKLTSQTDTVSAESVSVVQDCVANCVDQYKESDTVKDDVISKSDELKIKESSVTSSEKQPDCPGLVLPLEDQGSTKHQKEDKAIIKTLCFEEPFNTCTSVQTCNGSEAPGGSPVQHLNAKCPDEELKESSKSNTSPARVHENPPLHSIHSQLLLSPPVASTPFITPHLRSSALLSSPTLPSLGFTPHCAALPLTSSPSAPAITLPPPHSPSIQALSPPALSPCPSFTSLPPSQPPTSPAGQIQASSEQSERVEVVEPDTSVHSQGSGRQMGLTIEETVEEHTMTCTHTLKAPAGGCLVDACCLLGSSGGLCVAAAGKWAVCLWSQTSASKWSLIHTWAFSEPVINVFPVPDAAGLICVTLGQLEIREVRMLSCSSLLQVLLCDGLVQAVAGVSRSRVVTSSHSASGSTLQVLTLSDSGSTQSCQPLVSPGVCVGALAPVDGLSDALIGTDEGGCLFVWNLKTGQLLQRISLGDGLSHTACLRGFSSCGVLFVLLQHQLLSPEEEEKEEESKKSALLSLIAVNPLSGKSVLATHLYAPKAWSGRLCEADVNRGSVVGLSQSGCVCVWELGRRGASRMVWAPESEGWQMARWGAGGTLLTGHHNGDVTLHYDGTS
ncbi:partner and localizer of BRCA2 isoform X3 [Acanthopagrus latus]|uniref:partner and localizer of BRCA2 isoform X3 n=1 Tax=Acanthopagrus latus TaxID=8177 RepID=UPI00187C10CC|nr:partner and localizer of BRCA2 isoform X3 [Acanthopagrus latus]